MEDGFRYAIGADVGGTNIRAALVRSDGKILKLLRQREVILGKVDLEARLNRLVAMIHEILASPEASGAPLCGVGVGSGGYVSMVGEIAGHNRERDPNFQHIPIKNMLEKALNASLPVFIDNDSKVAAWGEYLFGAGRGTTHMVCLTVGTGIGGGIVMNGRLLQGANGFAGHLGFVSVNMYGPRAATGVRGCVEDYASGTAMADEARASLRAGRQSLLLEMAAGDIETVTCDQVFDACEAGDALAGEVIHHAAYALGIAVATLVNVFNPDVVVIGGGVAERGDVFLEPVRQTVLEYALRPVCRTPVKAAALGNLAGVSGAAGLTGFTSGNPV